MTKLLRREAPVLFTATRAFPVRERDGLQALATFFRITRDAVDKADSAQAAKLSAARLLQMFEFGETGRAVVDQPIVDQIIDEVPDLGLAWEAWCGLEEEFAVPRAYALEFIEGLQQDANGYRPETVEDLLRYAYRTGGVLALAICHILQLDPSIQQSLVDAGSAARLSTLAKNVYVDFSRGRTYVPLHWMSFSATRVFSKTWADEAAQRFDRHAAILYVSAQDAMPKLSYRARLAFGLALTAHRENRGSWLRKLDRTFDEFVRQSANALWNAVTRRPALPLINPSSLTARDAGIALRSQAIRFSRETNNSRL